MPIVNNITRLLESRNVTFRAFELPVEKLGADETAQWLAIDLDLIYKTIVVKRPIGKPILAVIPGSHRVDLKILAAEVGEKKVSLPTEKEAEELTGLLAGGISPLALVNKGFQVLIASQARDLPQIHVGGGERGLIIQLPPLKLAEITHARFAIISQKRPENP